MANALYDFGRDSFARKQIDWVNDDIRLVLVDTADYTVDLATHQHLDDVPAAARVHTSAASLANKTTDGAGVCDADDITLSSVSGDEAEALVLYLHTGTETTSILIAYIDSAGGSLPVIPNGTNIDIQWDEGSNKIFKL